MNERKMVALAQMFNYVAAVIIVGEVVLFIQNFHTIQLFTIVFLSIMLVIGTIALVIIDLLLYKALKNSK
jgi:hypothetical protein